MRSVSKAIGCVAVSMFTALGLAGCQDPPPMPLDDALAHYRPVIADIAAALEPLDAWGPIPEPVLSDSDTGGCRLFVDTGEGSSSHEQDLRYPEDWGPWNDALAPVLERHGFGRPKAERYGGLVGIEAHDRHGADFSMFNLGGPNRIQATIGVGVDPGDAGCTDEALDAAS